MKPALTPLLVLVAGAGLAAGSLALPAPPAGAPPSRSLPALAGGYVELVAQFEEAVDEWREKHRAAETIEERRELRKSHPVVSFYPRFKALAKRGEGRALLWMVGNARDYLGSSKKARDVKAGLYATLVQKHASEIWAGKLVASLAREKRTLGEEGVRKHLLAIGDMSKRDAVAAAAFFELAKRLGKGSDEERGRAEELWERIARDFGDTEVAAKVETARTAHLYEVGGRPPDFTTKDTDGVEFKLSDYSGKVVMLDFWGFW